MRPRYNIGTQWEYRGSFEGQGECVEDIDVVQAKAYESRNLGGENTEKANLKKSKEWHCVVISFVSTGEDDPQIYNLTDLMICGTIYIRNTEGESGRGDMIPVHFFRPCLSQDFYKTLD